MQIDLPDEGPRRNYIRRKRCLNESIQIIEKTLNCLANLRKDNIIKKDEISKLAKAHANEVEAACWAPRLRMSDDDYQNRMSTKTKELCLVLINKLLPPIDNLGRQKVPVPPKIPNKNPTPVVPTVPQINPPKSDEKPFPPIPDVAMKMPHKEEKNDFVEPKINPPNFTKFAPQILDSNVIFDPMQDLNFNFHEPMDSFMPPEMEPSLLDNDLDFSTNFNDPLNETI